MQEEMRYLLENHTYDLVKLPKGKKTLKNKWVYKLKNGNNSSQKKKKKIQGVVSCERIWSKKKLLTLKKYFLQ